MRLTGRISTVTSQLSSCQYRLVALWPIAQTTSRSTGLQAQRCRPWGLQNSQRLWHPYAQKNSPECGKLRQPEASHTKVAYVTTLADRAGSSPALYAALHGLHVAAIATGADVLSLDYLAFCRDPDFCLGKHCSSVLLPSGNRRTA